MDLSLAPRRDQSHCSLPWTPCLSLSQPLSAPQHSHGVGCWAFSTSRSQQPLSLWITCVWTLPRGARDRLGTRQLQGPREVQARVRPHPRSKSLRSGALTVEDHSVATWLPSVKRLRPMPSREMNLVCVERLVSGTAPISRWLDGSKLDLHARPCRFGGGRGMRRGAPCTGSAEYGAAS